MSIHFVLAQISGVIAWALLISSYLRKNTNKILSVQLLSIVFYCLNYFFLDAYAGLVIIIIEFIRDSLYCKSNKDLKIFFCTIPFYLIVAYFLRGNIFELLPIIASLIDGYTLTKKKFFVLIGSLFTYSLWVIYNIGVMSYTGVIADGLIVIMNSFIIIRYIVRTNKTNDFKIFTHYEISEKIINSINELDRNIYPKHFFWNADYHKELYKKNKNSFVFIKYKNKIIGYINFLAISKEMYNDIINDDDIIIDYTNEDILNYDTSSDNYLIIDSIVIKKKYANDKTERLCNKLISNYINKKKEEGFIIKKIVSVGVSDFEKEVLENSSLKKVKILKDNNILYEWED